MIPAAFREVRKYVRGDVQPEVIARAANKLRMKLVESGPELIRLTVRFNVCSWGERVTVALGTVDGSRLVDITSSCVLWTQIADWGKNERNVRRLFDEIDKVLGDECEHVKLVLCGDCGYLLVGIPAGICPECGHEHSANDSPRKQEMATVKNTMAFAVVITAFEFVLCFLLDLLGVGEFLPWLGARGAVFLLGVNLVALFAVVGLHRLAKRCTRRR
ncbi:MAG: hypothetical protein V1790_16770 [Planctomycetota bacterium]